MMRRNCRGFTLNELIVILGAIVILCVILFPSGGPIAAFAESRDRSKEAEVKSNIHTIQVALERYAVDAGGYYPSFLIGAETQHNILKMHAKNEYPKAVRVPAGATPFAKRKDEKYANQDYCEYLWDPLIRFGYMDVYPENPFAKEGQGLFTAPASYDHKSVGPFPYGGRMGDKMFDLGFGWGDTPQTDFVLTPGEIDEEQDDDGETVFAEPDLDAPGNFYYHPIFDDLKPVYLHYTAKYNSIYGDADQDKIYDEYGITGDEVVGYFLYGYGRPYAGGDERMHGIDVFNRMPASSGEDGKFVNVKRFMDGYNDFGGRLYFDTAAVGVAQKRVETSGYPPSEFDPWTFTSKGIDESEMMPDYFNPSRMRGDGVPDWVLIEVSSLLEM